MIELYNEFSILSIATWWFHFTVVLLAIPTLTLALAWTAIIIRRLYKQWAYIL